MNNHNPDHEQCSICYDVPNITVKLQCSHTYCYECIHIWESKTSNPTCPLCRTDFTLPIDDRNPRNKIRRLRRKIRELYDELEEQYVLLDSWIEGCTCGPPLIVE